MIGQWIGKYTGDVDGNIMINIDKSDKDFEIIAYITPLNAQIPSSVAYLKTDFVTKEVVFEAEVLAIDPRNFNIVNWDSIKHLYAPEISHSSKAKLKLSIVGDLLTIESTTDIGVQLSASLELQRVTEHSLIPSTLMSWDQYKLHVSNLLGDQILFRGQMQPWPLQTSFHRKGRYRTDLFVAKDVPLLHQRLCSITPHYFNLEDPKQNGAFFNLLQHHGYPTPLLDWSYSPFVAAFFAFNEWPKGYSADKKIRIYLFDNVKWLKHFIQLNYLNPPFAHLSVTDFVAINNSRVIPQQALTTVTNIVNIEAFIIEKEKSTDQTFLKAIDIPASYRDQAMRELRYMGITAGSMFPGIDGICEEIKDKLFE